MKADLHLHTCASDGTWRPETLVQTSFRRNGVFAVTEHDSVEISVQHPGLPLKTALNLSGE
jgi:predicted metal-dependent phosphoesterase TrpH